jgi:hypothetical protein
MKKMRKKNATKKKEVLVSESSLHYEKLYEELSWLGLMPASADFLLCLIFDSEEGGDMFLRNICVSQNYTVLQLRRPHSSQSSPSESQIQYGTL